MMNYIIVRDKARNYFFNNIYKNYPIFEMYFFRLNRKSLLKTFPSHTILFFGSWIFRVKKAKTIIIFETKYSSKIGEFIKKVNPNCKIILYYWNVIIDSARKGYLKDNNIDEFYTFDYNDSKKYHINYNPQFYSKYIKLPVSNNLEYDVFFIGRDKGRKDDLLKLEKLLNSYNITTKFIVISDEKEYIPYEAYLRYLSKSKVILDYVMSSQSGLSLRCMEALFFNKKMITNNKKIKDYDFYNSNNFFVFDDNIKINSLLNFFKKKNKKVDSNIMNYYDIDEWLKRFNI